MATGTIFEQEFFCVPIKRKRDFIPEAPVDGLREYDHLWHSGVFKHLYSECTRLHTQEGIFSELRKMTYDYHAAAELCSTWRPNKVRRTMYIDEMAQQERGQASNWLFRRAHPAEVSEAPPLSKEEEVAISLQLLEQSPPSSANTEPQRPTDETTPSSANTEPQRPADDTTPPVSPDPAQELEPLDEEQRTITFEAATPEASDNSVEPHDDETEDEEESQEFRAKPEEVAVVLRQRARTAAGLNEWSLPAEEDVVVARMVETLWNLRPVWKEFTNKFADYVAALVIDNHWETLKKLLKRLDSRAFTNFALMWKSLHARFLPFTEEQIANLLFSFTLVANKNAHRQCGLLLLAACRQGAIEAVQAMLPITRYKHCMEALERAIEGKRHEVVKCIERHLQLDTSKDEQAAQALKRLSPAKSDLPNSRTLTTARRNVPIGNNNGSLPVGSMIAQSLLATFGDVGEHSEAWRKIFVDNLVKLLAEQPEALAPFVKGLGKTAICNFALSWNDISNRGVLLSHPQIEALLEAFADAARPADHHACESLMEAACTHDCMNVAEKMFPHVSQAALERGLKAAQARGNQRIVDYLVAML